MTEHKVSSRYARAILDAAIKEGLDDTVSKDLAIVKDTVANSKELLVFFRSPVVQMWRKKKVIEEIFGEHIHLLTKSFLTLLSEKRREGLVLSIIAEFNDQYDVYKNRARADITTAIEITDDLKAKIKSKIEEWHNKEIIPSFKVNPNIKGGVLVRINDWVYDFTLRKQLEELYATLAE